MKINSKKELNSLIKHHKFKMKKIFKIIGSLLILMILILILFFISENEPLPKGEKGEYADALATKMITAINVEAFKNTEILEWNFRDSHYYKWLKNEDQVTVKWEKNIVHLLLNSPQKSLVQYNNIEVKGSNQKIIKQAQDFFNNDSFWLVAPYKVFDKGTERRIVKHNGKDALLVTYTSGGTTPGDSYLWILDSTGLPTAFKMWTQIIPLGGIEASWNDLKTYESGIKLPTSHTLSLFDILIDMGDVKAYNTKNNEL